MFTIAELPTILKKEIFLGCRYWVAGGLAIDLFLKQQTRMHKDLDLCINRDDLGFLLQLKNVLSVNYIVNKKSYPLNTAQLNSHIHEIHITNNTGFQYEVLLDHFDKHRWIYRRDHRISLELNFMHDLYLPPEIVLLYKAKNTSAIDNQDFCFSIKKFTDSQKKWLKDALILSDPQHPWTDYL